MKPRLRCQVFLWEYVDVHGPTPEAALLDAAEAAGFERELAWNCLWEDMIEANAPKAMLAEDDAGLIRFALPEREEWSKGARGERLASTPDSPKGGT